MPPPIELTSIAPTPEQQLQSSSEVSLRLHGEAQQILPEKVLRQAVSAEFGTPDITEELPAKLTLRSGRLEVTSGGRGPASLSDVPWEELGVFLGVKLYGNSLAEEEYLDRVSDLRRAQIQEACLRHPVVVSACKRILEDAPDAQTGLDRCASTEFVDSLMSMKVQVAEGKAKGGTTPLLQYMNQLHQHNELLKDDDSPSANNCRNLERLMRVAGTAGNYFEALELANQFDPTKHNFAVRLEAQKEKEKDSVTPGQPLNPESKAVVKTSDQTTAVKAPGTTVHIVYPTAMTALKITIDIQAPATTTDQTTVAIQPPAKTTDEMTIANHPSTETNDVQKPAETGDVLSQTETVPVQPTQETVLVQPTQETVPETKNEPTEGNSPETRRKQMPLELPSASADFNVRESPRQHILLTAEELLSGDLLQRFRQWQINPERKCITPIDTLLGSGFQLDQSGQEPTPTSNKTNLPTDQEGKAANAALPADQEKDALTGKEQVEISLLPDQTTVQSKPVGEGKAISADGGNEFPITESMLTTMNASFRFVRVCDRLRPADKVRFLEALNKRWSEFGRLTLAERNSQQLNKVRTFASLLERIKNNEIRVRDIRVDDLIRMAGE